MEVFDNLGALLDMLEIFESDRLQSQSCLGPGYLHNEYESTMIAFHKMMPDSGIISVEAAGNIVYCGATIISWVCQGEEILFLSKNAVFEKKAIRGGIPVVFPCFGPWSNGPQHGFARLKRWQVEIAPTKDSSGKAITTLSLEDDEETRKMWNFKFKLVYTLLLEEDHSFSMNFVVHNTDTKMFDFTCLLHTYFRTPDVTKTAVIGLQNTTYIDKVKDGKEYKEDREEILFAENYDRVYKNVPSEVVVGRIADGKRTAVIRTFNFQDMVVWNPWSEKAKAMSDFGDEEYKNMLCVEAGTVSVQIPINGGDNFETSQTFTIFPAP